MEPISLVSTAYLDLGQQGENLAKELCFDIKAWKDEYGKGSPQLLLLRPGDADPFPAVIRTENNYVYWPITQNDTAYSGKCKIQLLYFVSDVLTKSRCYTGFIRNSLSQPMEDIPASQQAFADHLAKQAARAELAADHAQDALLHSPKIVDSVWHIWDPVQETYISTGITAHGKTPQFSIRSVQTLTPGSNATAVISGPPENPELSLGIPQGMPGQPGKTEIPVDDTQISRKNLWTAQNIVEQLCTPFSLKSSNVISRPLLHTVLDVTATAGPLQIGTGQSSPINVRNFQKIDSFTLIRCGKNLLPMGAESSFSNGIQFNRNSDGMIIANGTASSEAVYSFPIAPILAQNLVLSGCTLGAQPSKWVLECIVRKDTGESVRITDVGRKGGIAVNQPGKISSICIKIKAGAVLNNLLFAPQLEYGSIASSYAPFRGSTFPVVFPHPGYAFYIDWKTGSVYPSGKVFSLRVSDMNNFEAYPGWKNIAGLTDVYPNETSPVIGSFTNVGNFPVGLNTLRESTIYLLQNHYHLSQSDWKSKYPDLTIQVYIPYRNPQPAICTFPPVTFYGESGSNSFLCINGEVSVSGHSDLVYQIQSLQKAAVAMGHTV